MSDREARRVDSGTPHVLGRVEDGVGVIELNRPERRNALHPDMYDAVPRLIEAYDRDDAVGCVLVTAAGPAFCAGGDVREGTGRRGGGDPAAVLARLARMVVLLRESPKISIAALPGPAVGAGVGLALAADLRIAAASATLAGGWARLAFSGDFGGAWLLTRIVGSARALEFLVGDEPVGAAAGERLGLVNRVVPDADLRPAALEWARKIAAGPRGAYASMKANVRDAETMGLREALPRESERMVRSGRSREHRDAVRHRLAARR
ncbi:enoyl-CoA hydratase/isomerase family protein [Actinomadura sp. WAC 06369]|uniref:enoyl-CoA hydratase/isomerase family protein n=1 Tax=Actinomadura sp. WAC 06369 TaxID=2203193 RepID=UPI000F78CFD7|nr:enoyl-CoA hydratase-related protein [Actinomadura sp. WAC 06369]RSN64350.1 enoyl-CoA hydratase [Actinomadura sp. WAC 06369]